MLILAGCQMQADVQQAVVEEQGVKDQDTTTKLDAFQGKTGNVLIKGYTEIGEVPFDDDRLGKARVSAMILTDVATGEKMSGVVIYVTELRGAIMMRGEISKQTDHSFIDYDEIDSLLNGIDYVSKATSEVTKLDHFEVIYRTKGKFQVASFGENEEKYVGANVKTASSNEGFPIGIEGLGELRTLIVKAKQELDSAK